MTKEIDIYDQFLKYEIPCVIFCRDLEPDEEFLTHRHRKMGFLYLGTGRSTSEFMAELIHTLSEELAPCITIHGVLVDVYGEGVLITGESGIGKSERSAGTDPQRGHRLVTDDVGGRSEKSQRCRHWSEAPPDITRYFIELRGIGIIDVKTTLSA